MPELIYEGVTGLVLFEEDVVEILNRFRQKRGEPEAGGILIGYKRPPHLHVIACTTPMKKDKRSRYRFHRKDPSHMKKALQYWGSTNGQAYCLGDWHTHPEDHPSPSYLDRLGWLEITRSKLGPDLLFLVVGRTNWFLQRQNKRLTIKGQRQTGTSIN